MDNKQSEQTIFFENDAIGWEKIDDFIDRQIVGYMILS